METIGREVSNITVFGWEWTELDSGSRFQLALPYGGATLTLGMLPKGQTKWVTFGPVSEPDRFLQGERPTTRKAWRAVVDRWFAAAEEEK